MPVDSTVGDLGDISLPLNPAEFSTTLAPADPARVRLMALFYAAITYELTATWNKINLTLATGHPLKSKAPIADKIELPPNKWVLQQRACDFPLLCLFRFGPGTWAEHTLELEKREQEWRLVYILPPLDVADLHKLGDVTHLVTATVRRVIRERGHKSYQSGALQFFAGAGGLGSLRLLSEETGPAQFAEGDDAPLHHAVTLTLTSTEYATDDAEEFGAVEGVDYSIAVGEETTAQPEVITAWSDVELEIS